MNDRNDYRDPEDDCPRTNRMEQLIDRADFLRDELRDREAESAMHRPQDGRICQCEDAPCCGCYDQ